MDDYILIFKFWERLNFVKNYVRFEKYFFHKMYRIPC